MVGKKCPHCGLEKVWADNRKRPAWICYPCKNDKSRDSYQRNREAEKSRSREWYGRNRGEVSIRRASRTYGVTIEEARALRGLTNCEACGQSEHLVIDHNHETGEVRGMLCNGCNAALGHAKDSVSVLRKLANYLEERGSYGTLDTDSMD